MPLHPRGVTPPQFQAQVGFAIGVPSVPVALAWKPNERPQLGVSAALAEMLKSYLDKTFGQQPDFSQDPAKESGPSQLIVWSYTGKGTNNTEAKLLGNSFIKQVGNKISLFTIVVPDEQFDELLPKTNEVLGSYKIDPAADLP